MLSLDEIRAQLEGCNYAEVARYCGCTRSYIQSIATIKRINPSYDTVKKLSDYFTEKHKEAGK